MPKKKSVAQKVKANATQGKTSTAGGFLALVLGALGVWHQVDLVRNGQAIDPEETTVAVTAILGGIYGIAGTGAKKNNENPSE